MASAPTDLMTPPSDLVSANQPPADLLSPSSDLISHPEANHNPLSDIPTPATPESLSASKAYYNSTGRKAKEFGEEALHMLEGVPIMGAEAQVGEAALPYLMSKAPAIEKGLNATGNAIASGASKVGSAIKGLPLTTQAFLSRFPKEELAKMYEYAKSEANPLEQEFKNWYEQKFTPVNRGDYNNAIAEGLPHELAVQATHRRSDLPQGVWYMKNLFNNNYVPSKMGGLTLDEFNKARETLLGDILPKELSEAQRLGTKYASYFPHTREAWEKLAAHGLGWEGATNWLLHTGLGLKSAGIPVALQSPRVNAEILRTAGKASKYANKAINTLGNYGSKVENALEPVTKPINSALDALLNATPVSVAAQQADPNNPYNVANHAKGGPITPAIPLTLSHPYYRKLNRSN